MPNIKQIITPDNTAYDIKDPTAVSNIIYNTTNSPALQKTINDTTTTIEVPDTTPTSGSKHLITSGAVYSTVGDINTILEAIIEGGGSKIYAKVNVTADADAVVSALSSAGTYTATANSSNLAVLEIGAAGTYTISATKNNASSNSTSVTVPDTGGTYTASVSFITLTITIPSESTYTVTDGTTTFSGTSEGMDITYYLPRTGTWIVSCTDGSQTASQSISVSSYTNYTAELAYAHIYGVVWDKSSSTAFTRTDESASFSDPNPYYAGMSGSPSSPFDNLMPWSGMVQETIDGNVLVKIPKFWYKITNTSSELKIQISDKAQSGFKVSPAHQARNASESDRDYVYIGRYKCNSSNYKSVSGASPKVSITRATARTSIAALGTGYCQQDFATFWTIRLLYLVEFANWNSQAMIGYGCGNGSSTQTTGASDPMPYHTGTMLSSRTTYSVGTQYRWIEDLWGNVLEWVDGIYFSSSYVYIITDPSNFSDTTGGTLVGTRATDFGEIKDFFASSEATLDWAMYPNSVYSDSSSSTYVTDYCSYNSSGDVLGAGGNYGQTQNCGLFFLIGALSASNISPEVGTRLLLLP